jgi:hypothetical protein
LGSCTVAASLRRLFRSGSPARAARPPLRKFVLLRSKMGFSTSMSEQRG